MKQSHRITLGVSVLALVGLAAAVSWALEHRLHACFNCP